MGQITNPQKLVSANFATPTVLVGLGPASAGVLNTALRSDAGLVLDQAIVPTWTGVHTFATAGTPSANTLFSPTAGIVIPANGNPIYDFERGVMILRTSAAFMRGIAYGSTGTLTAPGGVQNNDVLFAVAGGGYDTNIFATSQSGIQFNATETWSPTARGSGVSIFVTANGGTASATAIMVTNNANVQLPANNRELQLGASQQFRQFFDGTNCILRADAGNIQASIAGTTKLTVDTNRVTLAARLSLQQFTVATLPAGAQGDMAYVTDANAPTFLTAVAGGGAIKTPVFFNGAAWVAC